MTEQKDVTPERGKDANGDSRPASPSKAAMQALKEAEERRRKRAASAGDRAPRPKEVDGRDGPEPVRYGDWENKGRASDF